MKLHILAVAAVSALSYSGMALSSETLTSEVKPEHNFIIGYGNQYHITNNYKGRDLDRSSHVISIEYNDWEISTYRNGYDDQVGQLTYNINAGNYTFDHDLSLKLGVRVGAVYGYDTNDINHSFSFHYPILPIVMPNASLWYKNQLGIEAGLYPTLKTSVPVIANVSIKYKF